MTVALVETEPDPRLMQVRTLPADEPYPHWLVVAAAAGPDGSAVDTTLPPKIDSNATGIAAHRRANRPPAPEAALIPLPPLGRPSPAGSCDPAGSYTHVRHNPGLSCPSPAPGASRWG